VNKTTSHEIKNLLLERCLKGSGFIACTELSANNSDVFSINKNHYSTEFEIKTARGDLQKELNVIRDVLESQKIYPGYPKWVKHSRLLGVSSSGLIYKNKFTNYFYFCVTEDLEKKVADFIKQCNLPYGLIVVFESGSSEMGSLTHHYLKHYFELKTVVRAKRLITTPCPQSIIDQVARRACWEAYTLRQEIKPYGRLRRFGDNVNFMSKNNGQTIGSYFDGLRSTAVASE
jgi:hypothetical protein